MTEVSALLPNTLLVFMGKGYLVLESVLISQGSKDRKKHANLSHHLLSHKQNFSQARVNLLFRVIHSKRLI